MGAVAIFKGAYAKILASAGLLFKNGIKLITGSLDPSGAPVDAPTGSLYVSTSGKLYVKQDAGSTTNWLPVDLAQAQIVTVAQSGAMFTSVQDAIDSITDAAANKIYVIRIAPGAYIENITMKPFVVLFGVGSGPTAPVIIGKITASGFAANEFTAMVHINQFYTVASDGEVINDWSSPCPVNDFFMSILNTNDYGFVGIRQDCSGLSTNVCAMYLGQVLVNSTYDGSTKDMVAIEQNGNGVGHYLASFTVNMTTLASSGTIIGHKLSGTGATIFSSQNNFITINNLKAGSTATVCGRRTTSASTGFRIGVSETFRLTGYGTGIISCLNAGASAEMYHAGCTGFVDSTMTGYVTNTSLTDTQKVWLQSTNRDLGNAGAGLAIVTPYCQVQTGFDQWSTVVGSYWSYVASTRTFTLTKRATGMVRSSPVVCPASQSVVLTDYAVNFVYCNSSGVLAATTSTNYGALYRDNVVLFEVWVEGGRIISCTEAHPVEFSTAVSIWAHNGFGPFLRDATSTLTVNSSAGRTINFNGTNQILDHGITQDISSTTPVPWIVVGRRTSDGKAYMRGAAATAIPTYYDVSTAATVIAAGAFVVGRSYEIKTVGSTDFTLIGAANNNVGTCFTATGVGAGTGDAYRLTDDGTNGDWFVYRLGVLKSSLNSTDPQWICSMHTAVFANETAARNAIAAGTIATFPSEVLSLEIAQVGYAIIQGDGVGGSGASGAVAPVRALQIIGAQFVAGGTSTAGALITLLTTGFGGQLSGTESNTQAAFDRLDDYGYTPSWVATTGVYRPGNVVRITTEAPGFRGFWRCTPLNGHTASAAFATDVQAGRWELIGGNRCAQLINSPAHGLSETDLVYRTGAGAYAKADATDVNKAEVVGMVAGVTTDYFVLVQSGYVQRSSGTWTANAKHYLSTSTLGGAQTAEPSNGGEFIKECFWTISTTEAFVDIKSTASVKIERATSVINPGDSIFVTSYANASDNFEEWIPVAGANAGENAVAAVAFGPTPTRSKRVWLFGTDSAKSVTISTNDAAGGQYVEGGFVNIGKGTVVGFHYSTLLDRWIEISRTATVI